MKKSVEKIGKTVEEAIEDALTDLKLEREEVDVKVIDEGSKGFFGLFGSKGAKVVVTPNETVKDKAQKFLEEVFKKIGLEVEINIMESTKGINITLGGENMGILIGKRGETLDSLQYLTNLVANKGDEEYIRVFIDTEGYRKKREDTLIRLAKRLANKVAIYKKSITLEPMNPYERRIIHSTLQSNYKVTTYSIGEEPYRKVVITIKK